VLLDTPFVQYLIWRRNLDPMRFDFYHPRVGPLLAAQTMTPPTIPVIPTVVPPVIPSLRVSDAPVPVIPPVNVSAPEPSSAVIVTALFAAVFCWRGVVAKH
jgi:hypothetical protein